MSYFLVKDDYDDCSLAVVNARNVEDAIAFCEKQFADFIEGDLYAIDLPFFDLVA